MINLFPDQQESIDRVSEKMRGGCRSILLQGATGSGKAVMGAYLMGRVREKNKSAWFLVPRRDLIRQMKETFREFNIPHSYIAAGYGFNPYHKAHICSTDTIKGRLDKLEAPDIAFVDETHFGGDGLDRIIKWLKSHGTWIVGLSATPWKLSGQGLGCWYDEMVVGPSIRWLIDNSRLSDYRAFLAPQIDLSGIKTVAGDYEKGKLADRMEQDRVLIGNAVSHYQKHAMGLLNIAYCVSIKHSEITAQAFRDSGIAAMHMDGTTPDIDRQRIIRAYANRGLKVLTNNEILTFGFDLASQVGMDVTVESMSDLRPTKSLALQMQKWGRVLRYKSNPAIIFDHASNVAEHGQPCWEREWTLSDRMKNLRRSGERALPVRNCKKCFYVFSPHLDRCPSCGHIHEIQSREIDEVEGELQELAIQQQKKEKRMEVGKAKTLDDLRRIQKERGYDQGWIWKQAALKRIKR